MQREPGCDDDVDDPRAWVMFAEVLAEGKQRTLLGLRAPSVDVAPGPLRVEVRPPGPHSGKSVRQIIAEHGAFVAALAVRAWERGDVKAAALYDRHVELLREKYRGAR